MKKLLLTTAILGVTTTFTLADPVDTAAENLSENILQKDGVFYPSYDVLGKSYYGGLWYDTIDMTSSTATWRTTMEDIAQGVGYGTAKDLAKMYGFAKEPADPDALLQDYGYNTPEELASAFGYSSLQDMLTSNGSATFDELALTWGYGTGDPEAMLAAYGGISYVAGDVGYQQNLQMTAAQKGSLLDAISNNTLTNADYDELFQNNGYGGTTENALFKTNGTFDPAFTNKLIQTFQNKQPTLLQEFYGKLGGNFAANPEGVGQTDLTGWENPNLNYFPVNESNLTWDQINSASNYNQANLAGMDVSNLQTSGKSLFGVNLENTTITGAQLNAANNIEAVNLQGTNIAGFTANGKSIFNINFNNVEGITAANLNGSTRYQAANFGNLDMTGFAPPINADFYQTDFSKTTNFQGSMLNNANSIQSSNLTGKNLTGFNPAGKNLYRAKLTNTTGLTAAQVASASNIRYLNLQGTGITKAQLETALVAAGKSISAYNFATSSILF